MLKFFKRILSVRYLFDDWFLVLLRYFLIKLGLSVKLEAKVGGCKIKITPDAFARLVSRFSQGLINSVICVNGRVYVNNVEVSDINEVIYSSEVWGKVNGWSYDKSCDCWSKNNVKFRHMYDTIVEVFDYGVYESLNVNGKVVIDVGAYIGDSSIYFALRGAKRVIAIEPHPQAFREMVENVRLNNLEDKIIPINAGLADKLGKICIEEVDIKETCVIHHRLSINNCVDVVPAITLSEVISKYGVAGDLFVLKMDCEGCEYDVILNDYEHVSIFKELLFEYYAYVVGIPVSKLLKKLAKDYDCNVIKRGRGFGFIHCLKRS
jgi:FkbM family methyltransferase